MAEERIGFMGGLHGDIYRWFYEKLLRKPSNCNGVIPNTLAGSGLLKTQRIRRDMASRD